MAFATGTKVSHSETGTIYKVKSQTVVDGYIHYIVESIYDGSIETLNVQNLRPLGNLNFNPFAQGMGIC